MTTGPGPDESDGAPGPRPSAPAREPSLLDAILPLVTLAVLIGGSIALFGLDALDGPIQVALVLCAMVAALIAVKNGHSVDEVQHAAQGSVASVTSAISWELDGDELTVERARTTLMACDDPPGVMEQEAALLQALESAARVEIAPGTLTILDAEGAIAMAAVQA
jgi:hypothetical protein